MTFTEWLDELDVEFWRDVLGTENCRTAKIATPLSKHANVERWREYYDAGLTPIRAMRAELVSANEANRLEQDAERDRIAIWLKAQSKLVRDYMGGIDKRGAEILEFYADGVGRGVYRRD